MTRPSVLVLGGSGLVGSHAVTLWADRFVVSAPSHRELDVLDAAALARLLTQSDAACVVNFAGWADVDGAEAQRGDESGPAYQLNVELPGRLATLCRRLDKHLLHISTDYVFDGTSVERPYTEQDPPHPLGWYAQTKVAGEHAALEAGARVGVARIEMPFTGRDHPKRDLARTVVARLRQGQSVVGVIDQQVTPLFLDDGINALARLVEGGWTGIMHVASSSSTSPFAFATGIARRLGLDLNLITPAPFERFAATRPARRPQHSWLDVSRFTSAFGTGILRPVDVELDAWASQVQRAIIGSSR